MDGTPMREFEHMTEAAANGVNMLEKEVRFSRELRHSRD